MHVNRFAWTISASPLSSGSRSKAFSKRGAISSLLDTRRYERLTTSGPRGRSLHGVQSWQSFSSDSEICSALSFLAGFFRGGLSCIVGLDDVAAIVLADSSFGAGNESFVLGTREIAFSIWMRESVAGDI